MNEEGDINNQHKCSISPQMGSVTSGLVNLWFRLRVSIKKSILQDSFQQTSIKEAKDIFDQRDESDSDTFIAFWQFQI